MGTLEPVKNPLDDLLASTPAAASVPAKESTAGQLPQAVDQSPVRIPPSLHRNDLAHPERVRWKGRPLWVQPTQALG